MSDFIEKNLDHDGVDRRGFLKCMAWAGTGALCVIQGGVLKSFALSDVLQQKIGKKLISVFIPTTPNPTSGFLVLFPEERVTRLDMSVPDGIKYIVSLGSIAPEHLPRQGP